MGGSDPSVSSMMDDAERMELALNTDFTSELLDCFDGQKDDDMVVDVDDHCQHVKLSDLGTPPPSCSLPQNDLPGSPSWDSHTAHPSNNSSDPLPSLFVDPPDDYRHTIDYLLGGAAMPPLPSSSSATTSRGTAADASSSIKATSQNPPFASVASENASLCVPNSHRFPQLTTEGETKQFQSFPSTSSCTQPNYHPQATSNSAIMQEQNISTKPHPEGIPSSANCPPYLVSMSRDMVPSNASIHPSVFPLAYSASAAGLNFSNTHPMLFRSMSTMESTPVAIQPMHHTALPRSHHTSKSDKRRTRKPKHRSSNAATPPPFHLFDAPMELRANFIKVQQSLGLPILQDNNSYHYQKAIAESNNNVGSTVHTDPKKEVAIPRLIDGRHTDRSCRGGSSGSSRENRAKNAKEQKRAQKIAELIDQLRAKMEDGGWKISVKSKFHTLSNCAEYVRHLMQVNKEKEIALEKAKDDLLAKRNMLKEDKSLQQTSSDPESSTSSLTVSSYDKNGIDNSKNGPQQDDMDTNESEPVILTAMTSDNQSCPQRSDVLFGDSNDCNGTPSALHPENTISESDVTDSVRESFTNKTPQEFPKTISSHSTHKQPDCSVLSEATITTAHDSMTQEERQREKATIESRKRKTERPPDSLFDLDYQDVFMNSNVPQLLATSSGKVMAWNLFFLKATGFSEREARSLSIFSLVPPDKLSLLFEIVASALKKLSDCGEEGKNEDIQNQADKKTIDQEGKEVVNYSALTLPCVVFPGQIVTCNPELPHPLYMTVTLMSDEDPRKRCFLCVFTDAPGTGEALGSISVELLSRLVTTPIPSKAHPAGHTRHRSKKRHCPNTFIVSKV